MKKILLTVLWFSAGLSATMAQKATISFNPPKGKTYEYRFVMDQKIKQEYMGQEINTLQKMVTVYDVNVLENSKDRIETNYVYKEIYYEMSGVMGSTIYDSTKPAENPNPMTALFSKIFGQLIDKKFDVTHAPDGSVISVTGMELILEDMKKALSTEAQGNMLDDMMSKQFSNEAIKKTLEQSMKIYPKGTIKVGDTWSIEQQIDAGEMEINVASTYQLNAVKEKIGYVHVNSTIGGRDGKLEGEQSGDLEFDLKTGLTISSVISQTIKGSVAVQGMEIPTVIESEITITTK